VVSGVLTKLEQLRYGDERSNESHEALFASRLHDWRSRCVVSVVCVSIADMVQYAGPGVHSGIAWEAR
jgi:hypothetical protein